MRLRGMGVRLTAPSTVLYVGRMAAFGSVTVREKLVMRALTRSSWSPVMVMTPPWR